MNCKITKIKNLNELENLSQREREIFEQMARLEHQRWASWQSYLHSKCARDDGGNLIIPSGYVKNLERLIRIPYEELSKKEKDTDREEVLKTWSIIADL